MTYNTKPPRQMPERDFWEAELAEAVYESMTGLRTDEARLDWVEDIFVPGHPCFEAYLQIRQALPAKHQFIALLHSAAAEHPILQPTAPGWSGPGSGRGMR